MELLSRKATDKEIGLAKTRLETVLGYWANQWNYRQLPELPDYVQDLYILYTYTLWLEEQIAILREEKKNDDVRDDSRKSDDISEASDLKSASDADDKGGDSLGTELPQAELRGTVAPPVDGTGGIELRHEDTSVLNGKELDV